MEYVYCFYERVFFCFCGEKGKTQKATTVSLPSTQTILIKKQLVKERERQRERERENNNNNNNNDRNRNEFVADR